MNKKIIIVSAIISLTTYHASSQKFITTRGREIIGTDGKPFLIRGTNLGNWLVPEGYMFKFRKAVSARQINEVINQLIGPDKSNIFWKKFINNYVTEKDIHYLKTLGMNSIRIPFSYKLFTTEDYMGANNPQRGFELLDKVIRWCKTERLYVILDMHCAPGGQTGDNIDDSWGYPFLFENAASRQMTVNIWQRIASHYKNEEIVLGYDLLNEPIAHYFDSSKLNPLLEPLYREIVKAIRKVDPNHLVFLGGAQWDSNFKIFGLPFDKKLVYTFHKYWTATTQDVIQEYLDFREKYNVPVYCGETGENTDDWVLNFRKLLEGKNIGWHFWPYKKPENSRGIVQFKLPASYSQVIEYADTIRTTFSDIRKVSPKNTIEVEKALEAFLQNCIFENCTPNAGYIRALGLGKSDE